MFALLIASFLATDFVLRYLGSRSKGGAKMKKIKFGFIGCGSIANVHASNIKKLENKDGTCLLSKAPQQVMSLKCKFAM